MEITQKHEIRVKIDDRSYDFSAFGTDLEDAKRRLSFDLIKIVEALNAKPIPQAAATSVMAEAPVPPGMQMSPIQFDTHISKQTSDAIRKEMKCKAFVLIASDEPVACKDLTSNMPCGGHEVAVHVEGILQQLVPTFVSQVVVQLATSKPTWIDHKHE